MTPTAYSQVWEQIVRIAVILLGSYLVIYVFNGEKSTAVGIATFAAFVGGVAGIVPLLHYTKKLNIKWFRKKKNTEIQTKKMYKEIIWYAMPIILVGLSITIFQTIDTYSINNYLILKGKTLAEAELINSIVSLVQKIIVIPLAIATALSMSLIPYVTKSYENKNNEEIRSWINKAIGANYLVVLPATVGLILLGGPIYASIFGIEYAKLGGEITLYFGLAALMFSIYTITAAILQGMNKNRVLIVSLIVGITLKLITNYPLVLFFEGGGTALSTYIAFFAMNLIQMAEIQKQARYNWSENTKKFKNIFTATLVTTIVLLPFSILALSSENYLENVMLTILAVGASGLSYVFVLVKTKEIQKYIPEEKLNKITKKILRK
jgi:O-antigen/teichoic acid export membrane protein